MYSISFQEDSLLPRERLVKEGVEALSNQELLAILLRTGTRQANVFEIAQKVLNSLTSLTDLKKMTLQELQSLSGSGALSQYSKSNHPSANYFYRICDTQHC
ncbi:DNA repair protein RadC domain protein [Streptococcus oralis SK1074]|nr:DNA repair protein RadC domain protein [Streptococcus oralis SK1074]